MKLTESVHHYLDGASGQYIPKRFARETKRECILNVKAEDLGYLARGPGGCQDDDETLTEGETIRGEHYWDVWQTVLDNAILLDPESGLRFKLHQDDSVFLVPEHWEWNDDINGFEPPESDTLKRFGLYSHWASLLINGDASGMTEAEEKEVDAFLEREELQRWTCADVSEQSHFVHRPDSGGLAGTVSRFTFILIGSPEVNPATVSTP